MSLIIIRKWSHMHIVTTSIIIINLLKSWLFELVQSHLHNIFFTSLLLLFSKFLLLILVLLQHLLSPCINIFRSVIPASSPSFAPASLFIFNDLIQNLLMLMLLQRLLVLLIVIDVLIFILRILLDFNIPLFWYSLQLSRS